MMSWPPSGKQDTKRGCTANHGSPVRPAQSSFLDWEGISQFSAQQTRRGGLREPSVTVLRMCPKPTATLLLPQLGQRHHLHGPEIGVAPPVCPSLPDVPGRVPEVADHTQTAVWDVLWLRPHPAAEALRGPPWRSNAPLMPLWGPPLSLSSSQNGFFLLQRHGVPTASEPLHMPSALRFAGPTPGSTTQQLLLGTT